MPFAGSQSPLLERVVAQLRVALQGGRYEHNRPLPSHRAWAQELGVSTFTISRAMEVLKGEGIVESEEGSYTFLRRAPGETVSVTKAAKVRLWISGRRDFRKLRHAIGCRRFQTAFRARHPGAEIEETASAPVSEVFETELVDALVRGGGPTTGGTKWTWLSFLAEHGALAAWEERPGFAQFIAGIQPEILNLCRLPSATNGLRTGEAVMLPATVTRLCLLLNREDFRRAGLDPEKGLGDWESFRDMARKLSRSMNGAPALHFRGWGEAVWWLMQFAAQAGGTAAAATDWAGAAMRQALDFIVGMHVEGWVQVHEEDPALFPAKCLSSGFPMCFGGIAHEILHLGEAGRFAVAPPPVGPMGRSASLMNLTGWFLNAHASEEDRNLAADYALEYEGWLHDGEGGARMESLGVPAQVWSLRRRFEEDRYFARQMPPSWQAGFARVREDVVIEPPGADADKLAVTPVLREALRLPTRTSTTALQRQLVAMQQQFGLPPTESSIEAAPRCPGS